MARLLNTLPFVAWEEVEQVQDRKHPKIVIEGHFDFPAERVIGVQSFESWAGRGEAVNLHGTRGSIPNGKGDKGFTPQALEGMEQTSRGAITEYAHLDSRKLKDVGSNAEIVIVRDAAGEHWGIATMDGSHRTAAAKLRGDAAVAVSRIEIASEDDMSRLGYVVQDRFPAKAE